jgi:hypothetical protein
MLPSRWFFRASRLALIAWPDGVIAGLFLGVGDRGFPGSPNSCTGSLNPLFRTELGHGSPYQPALSRLRWLACRRNARAKKKNPIQRMSLPIIGEPAGQVAHPAGSG